MEPAKEVQVETPEVPVTVPAQVEVVPTVPPPVTEEPVIPEEKPVETPPAPIPPKEITPPPTNEAVPQSEWQQTQEEVKALKKKDEKRDLEAFEKEFPIVNTEKYAEKWKEILKLKATQGHKYENLSYEELLNQIRDNSIPQEPKPAPTPVPSINPSLTPEAPRGDISKQSEDMLGQRYSPEQIASTKE